MNKIIISILPILSLTVLTGCTTTKTLEDFYSMSSGNRAITVCNNANAERIAWQTLRQINAKINSMLVSITERNQALERGYRVHKSCTSTPVTKTVCSEEPSAKKVICREQDTWTTKTTCTETPVGIDADYEERKVSELNAKVSELKTDRAFKESDRNNRWNECLAKVEKLFIEEAYKHYANKTRP